MFKECQFEFFKFFLLKDHFHFIMEMNKKNQTMKVTRYYCLQIIIL